MIGRNIPSNNLINLWQLILKIQFVSRLTFVWVFVCGAERRCSLFCPRNSTITPRDLPLLPLINIPLQTQLSQNMTSEEVCSSMACIVSFPSISYHILATKTTPDDVSYPSHRRPLITCQDLTTTHLTSPNLFLYHLHFSSSALVTALNSLSYWQTLLVSESNWLQVSAHIFYILQYAY